MNALDDALRDMLRTRAQDITALPPALLERVTAPDDKRPAAVPTVPALQHRTRWLVAAAVAAVLVIGGATLAVRSGTSGRHRPSHVSSSITPPPTPPSHARREAALSWFGMAPLPGYELRERESDIGERTLAVRRTSDTGIPIGCNGCEQASDYVHVYDRGAFDAAQAHLSTWQHTTVSGRPAYLGSMTETNGHYVVPTLAWQYRPDSWALVQGVTTVGGEPATLHAVASAVRPAQSVAIPVPFTLAYVPDLPVTQVMDDRSEGYAFEIQLGRPTGREFTISVTASDPSNPPTVAHTAANRRSIGGLTGYYDPAQCIADIQIHGAFVELSIARQDSQFSSLPLTATDRRDMLHVLAGLHWTNGDGSAPYAAAEHAIP